VRKDKIRTVHDGNQAAKIDWS